ncbi:MerR family DNA-binding transcriptional regulator [Streptomyces mirabilis]|uniref:MerR family DNA-binding transcriptional regulator n=1 Tax=Streptomyces mirabilis TaxID=68239 RepID=UPI0033AFC448
MRIGELATMSGVAAKTIRFYEQSGLMPEPPRTAGGYRDYPAHAATRLTFIHLGDIDRRMAELRKTRTALKELAQRAAATDPASCSDADICRILSQPAGSIAGSVSP